MGGAVVRMAGDEADASMPQADQITGHVARGGTVVGADFQPFHARIAGRQPHIGHVASVQRVDQRRHVGHRRRQHHAGAGALARRLRDLLGQALGAVIAGLQQQAVEIAPARVQRPLLDVDQVVVAGIVVHQHDEVGALAGQPARGWIGLVLQQLDRGHDLGARLLAGVRLVVEHARHGLDGHARLGGHIIDRDGTRSLPLAMPQHSTMLTASPRARFPLYLVFMSAPVSRMVLMTESSDT